MYFLVPRPERISPAQRDRAYLAGMEGIPWQGKVTPTAEGFAIDRDVDDSGSLYIPWQVPGHGLITLSTANLMERDRPYHLTVELARGTLNRVRNQLAAWQSAGLVVSDEVLQQLKAATGVFAQAATAQGIPLAAEDSAERAIRQTLDAAALLAAEYTAQALVLRHRQTPKLSTIFAGRLHHGSLNEQAARAFLGAFNAAVVPLNWRRCEANAGQRQWGLTERQIDWCRKTGLKVISGPLVQLDAQNVPDWLYLWEEEFDEVESYLMAFVKDAVERFKGKVHAWQCAARMNVGTALSLSEEQRLRLTVAALQTVRSIDERTPLVVSFDQPWCEFLADSPQDLPPLHFADALVRHDLGVAGLGLEINLGYWPGGTLPRDLLEISRQLDRWGQLGLPLLVSLTTASAEGPDAKANCTEPPIAGGICDTLTPEAQAEVVQRLVPLLLAKASVQGIIWNQLDDAQPHDFPHGGLIDVEGNHKPAFAKLAEIRQAHLA